MAFLKIQNNAMHFNKSFITPDRIVLFAGFLLSPFLVHFGAFTLGLHVIVIIAVASLLAMFGGRKCPCQLPKYSWLIGLFAAYYVISFVLSPCRDLVFKSIGSLAVFVAMVSSLLMISSVPDHQVRDRDVLCIALFITLSVAYDKIALLLSHAASNIVPSGIYSEPSHLGLVMAPLLCTQLFSRDKVNIIVALCVIPVMFFMAGSATFFVMFSLCMAITFIATRLGSSTWKSVSLAVAILMFLLVAAILSPFGEKMILRVTGIFHVYRYSNLSSIVYVYGWETAWANLVNTHGLGLGFNRMGCYPRPFTDAGAFLSLFKIQSNVNDGSFTVSKLISELGLFGVGLLAAAGYCLVKIIAYAKHVGQSDRTRYLIMLNAVVVMLIGGFVRGSGYFFGSFVLGLYSLLFLVTQYPILKKHRV